MDYSIKQIKNFLFNTFGIQAVNIKKIKCGVLNSNYIIKTNKIERFIFRIYNFKTASEVKYEVDILEYLKRRDFPSPRLIAKNDNFIFSFAKRPVVLYKYIEGENIKRSNELILKQIGRLAGRLHIILRYFKPKIFKPTWDPIDLKKFIIEQGEEFIKSGFPGANEIVNFTQKELEKYNFPPNLPKGITHQDIKGENIIVKNNKLQALIDFDNSYRGVLLHDITTTIIWMCFSNNKINKRLLNAFLSGYCQVRSLSKMEERYLLDSIKFRLVREIFIGPFVTRHYPTLSIKRLRHFQRLYKNIQNSQCL